MGKKKPKVKKKATKGVWKAYDAKDKLTRKNKYCPKCGEGYFLAKHKDREACGKCGYAEFGKKSE